VHGAFADSTNWNGVIRRLRHEGCPVVAAALVFVAAFLPEKGERGRVVGDVPRNTTDLVAVTQRPITSAVVATRRSSRHIAPTPPSRAHGPRTP